MSALQKAPWKCVESLLFWLSGTVTLVWVTIMGCVAHGFVPPDHDPGWWECTFYVSAVGFLLGVKGTRQRHNHNGDDMFFGEVWAVILILNAFFILFEYYTPFHLMEVTHMPAQLITSALGVIGLFGSIKLLEIPELIRKAIKVLKA